MSQLRKKHPCDTCGHEDCYECALESDINAHECRNYECAYEYDGLCELGVYSRCGAWKERWDGQN